MRALLRGLTAMVILLTSCVAGGLSGLGGIPGALAGGLQPFQDCEDVLSYVQQHALRRVTAWGLPGALGGPEMFFGVAEAAADGDVSRSQAAPVPGVDYSTTNIQTAGVDEPDLVKTDGERLVALARERLFVLDVSGDEPELLGSLRVPDVWVRDLLLLGDRALLLGEAGGDEVREPMFADVPVHGGAVAALVEVDLSDPDDPRVARRMLLDGRYLSARMRDGVVRVVVRSYPGLAFVYPHSPGLRGRGEALERNREIIRESSIEDWVPYHIVEDAAGAVLEEGPLLGCASAHRAPEFSGFGMLTVVTLDLAEGLEDVVTDDAVGVLSDGETVYASTDSLYVATQRWIDPRVFEEGAPANLRDEHATRIHRFDTSDPGAAQYRSSGEVPGWLLNQFSMDEHEGRLRVASTDSPPFWTTRASESIVTVLEEREGRLVPTGSVGGLGEGERIFAVRFLGDLGYVVTFRQVDPLYVLDLSDPEDPRVTGELKIAGYSAYLHPAGPGRLLGVGQDATLQGRLRGTQVSLFDVTDPADPRRIDTVKVAKGSSEAEWDHHAFLYWEPDGLVVVPVATWGGERAGGRLQGAIALRLDGDELEEARRLEHDRGRTWERGIRRSLVIGDRLYTVSEVGVEAVDLATLEDRAWVPFPP